MTEIKLGIAKLIDDAIVKQVQEKGSRDYMGASGLGTECSRELWYSYHQPKPILDPRVNRIFRVGDLYEDYVIKLLRDAGMTIYTEMENGEQFGFVDGKIAGHIDGVITGLPESTKPHLLEIKSANAKRFKAFTEKGFKSDKKYWTQIHVYMLKMGLGDCLVVVINKDNCELYFERVKLDKKFAERQLLRGHEISNMVNDIPVRPYSKPTFYKCKFCNYHSECWNNIEE